MSNNFNNETIFEFCGDFKVGYTVVPNYILNEENISAKALGIYTKILQYQHSSKHVITVKGLVSFFKDGRDSINNGLKELITLGYIRREKKKSGNGKFEGWKYTVYVEPNFDIENSTTENGKSDFGKSDFGKSVHNKENIIKKKIYKKENINIKSSSSKKDEEEEIKIIVDNKISENNKSIDGLEYIINLCENFGLNISKANIKRLIPTYTVKNIINAINTIVNTSTYEKGEIKNYNAYLVKTLNDMNAVKVINNTFNTTINKEPKTNKSTDYSQRNYTEEDYNKIEKAGLAWMEDCNSTCSVQESLNKVNNNN